jgi:hypothetical protein
MWSSNAAVSDEILLDTMNTTAVYATFSCYSFIFPAEKEKEVSQDVHWIEHGDIVYMDVLNLSSRGSGVDRDTWRGIRFHDRDILRK